MSLENGFSQCLSIFKTIGINKMLKKLFRRIIKTNKYIIPVSFLGFILVNLYPSSIEESSGFVSYNFGHAGVFLNLIFLDLELNNLNIFHIAINADQFSLNLLDIIYSYIVILAYTILFFLFLKLFVKIRNKYYSKPTEPQSLNNRPINDDL